MDKEGDGKDGDGGWNLRLRFLTDGGDQSMLARMPRASSWRLCASPTAHVESESVSTVNLIREWVDEHSTGGLIVIYWRQRKSLCLHFSVACVGGGGGV